MNMKEVILEKQGEIIQQVSVLLKRHACKTLEEKQQCQFSLNHEDIHLISDEIVNLLARILNVDLRPEPQKKPELGVLRWRE